MKLVFICGSLEPGRDGVGDYTRRLSSELADRGHTACLIAINDAFVTGDSPVEGREGAVTLVRFPRSLDWSVRRQLLMETIRAANPDWVSVQFVPFAFHPKGLCWRWLGIQEEISRGYKLHVMFHEIWVAWCLPAKLTSRLLGVLQHAVFTLARPGRFIRCGTTTLALYEAQLRKVGIVAGRLPLLGNIPVTPAPRAEVRNALLARLGLAVDRPWYLAGFFGSLLPTFSAVSFERWLRDAMADHASVVILCAGRHDKISADNWALITRLSEGKAPVFNLGALEVEQVSGYLKSLDVGLSGYPAALSGKSSAAASMREHGLEVMALGAMRPGREENPDPSLVFSAEASGVKRVTDQFLELLNQK